MKNVFGGRFCLKSVLVLLKKWHLFRFLLYSAITFIQLLIGDLVVNMFSIIQQSD